MPILRLEDDTIYTQVSDIQQELDPLNIQINSWPIGSDTKLNALLAEDMLSSEEKATVLKGLDKYFQELAKTAGYKERDLIVLHSSVPNLDAMLSKFDKTHTHADPEVRYIIAGEGIFGFVRPDGSQVELTVQPEDYINVPSGVEHWFYLTSSRQIKAIRYFTTTEGWVPDYTDTQIRLSRPSVIDPRPTLIAAAHQFYQKGWMVGTAGNLSARISNNSFWITASGCLKNKLSADDFVSISLDRDKGEFYSNPTQSNSKKRPSAETSIHAAIYNLFPDAQVCYHVHSIENNLVSRFTKNDTVPLPPLEMLKGLGVWEENPRLAMPIFANHLEVSRIADEIYTRFKDTKPQIPALLIRDHGVTVWADSLEIANNYIEVLEYIFRYMVASQKLKG